MKKNLTFIMIIVCSLMMLNAQNTDFYKYKRSSLYTIQTEPLQNAYNKYNKELLGAFLSQTIPTKYNNHDLLVRSILVSRDDEPAEYYLRFLNKNQVGKRLVAKWFNRDANTGFFNMDTVFARGHYNATELDLLKAQMYARGGLSTLLNAGDELIDHTYIVIHDVRYIDKELEARKAAVILSAVSAGVSAGLQTAAAVTTDASTKQALQSADAISQSAFVLAATTADLLGKGFGVVINSYLYQLVWNDEVAEKFTSQYWIDKDNPDANKKKAYESDSTLFTIKYIGTTKVTSNVQSSKVSMKSNQEVFLKAINRAQDRALVELQREYEEFKVKSSIFSIEDDVVKVKIGMKEGVNEDSQYEVLEVQQEEDGKIIYKRVGIICPMKNKIWDNQFFVGDEDKKEDSKFADLGATDFKIKSGKNFYPGMLIREIK